MCTRAKLNTVDDWGRIADEIMAGDLEKNPEFQKIIEYALRILPIDFRKIRLNQNPNYLGTGLVTGVFFTSAGSRLEIPLGVISPTREIFVCFQPLKGSWF